MAKLTREQLTAKLQNAADEPKLELPDEPKLEE